MLKGRAQTNKLSAIREPYVHPILCIGSWWVSPGPGLGAGEGTGALMPRLCAQQPAWERDHTICHPNVDTFAMNHPSEPQIQTWAVPGNAGCTVPQNLLGVDELGRALIPVAVLITCASLPRSHMQRGRQLGFNLPLLLGKSPGITCPSGMGTAELSCHFHTFPFRSIKRAGFPLRIT